MRDLFKDRILNPVKLSRLHGMDTKERSLSGSQKRHPPGKVFFRFHIDPVPPGVPPPPVDLYIYTLSRTNLSPLAVSFSFWFFLFSFLIFSKRILFKDDLNFFS